VWERPLHQRTLQKEVLPLCEAAEDVLGGDTSYMCSLLLMAVVSPRTGMTLLEQ